MNIAYIMRGVPGSGKSTLAKILGGEIGCIHSTDAYFYQNGQYTFDPSLLSKFHNKNFTAFCESLRKRVPIVICDNTNTRRWHFERYIQAATKEEYLVALVAMPHPTPEVAARRNTHNVSEYAIRKMIAEWEH